MIRRALLRLFGIPAVELPGERVLRVEMVSGDVLLIEFPRDVPKERCLEWAQRIESDLDVRTVVLGGGVHVAGVIRR